MYKFKSEEHNDFSWASLGDIKLGRENLGDLMPVSVYRLFSYTLRAVLTEELGVEKTSEFYRKAGLLAGRELCKNLIDKKQELSTFFSQLQSLLKDLKVGILKIEKENLENMEFYIVIEEDLDCSGLPISGETVCEYDEGFLAGVFNEFTGKDFTAEEIDCWATGDRVCRFIVKPK